MRRFNRYTLMASGLAVLAVHTFVSEQNSRRPASSEGFELKIQEIALDGASKLNELDDIFVRAHMPGEKSFEFLRETPLDLARGDKKQLSLKLDVDASWIRDDSLEFKLEVVEAKGMNHVVVRCSNVARNLSGYNRVYQCHIPGESTPVLSYRVGRKGTDMTPQVAKQ